MFFWGSAITSVGDNPDVSRLDLPPPSHARLRLPDSIGRRFVILADAEEEFDWTKPLQRSAISTETINALPQANQFFTARACVPTYLVDWPVVSNRRSAEIMRGMAVDGDCEIGTQLHPWVNPPFDEDVTITNSFAGNLPPELEAAKLELLTEKVKAATGVQPIVYRAGRYGVGSQTAALLMRLGYRLDVSVRSSFDYRPQGGPDFLRHPIWPWALSETLSALPLTVTNTGLLRRMMKCSEHAFARGLLARAGLFDRVPLTPEGVRLHDALIAIRQLLNAGHQLFSLSFHTPSLVPGHTPYVRSAIDLKEFWRWWDGVFDLFSRFGVMPIRSSEIATALVPA